MSQCKNIKRLGASKAIMASAGTGKTTQLAFRFINLLHAGVTPSEILAITFTQKAAGEIFEKIISMIREMIEDPEKLIKYQLPQSETGPEKDLHICEEITGEELTNILRELLNGKNKLQISTIDSFFVQLVQGFALELGVFGEISVGDNADKRPYIRALRKLIRKIPPEQRDLIRELVKGAQNGDETTSYYNSFKKLVDRLYEFFLRHPEKQLWAKSVWSESAENDELKQPELEKLAAAESGSPVDATPSAQDSFAKYLQSLKDFAIPSLVLPKIPEDVKKFIAKLTEDNGTNWLDGTQTLYFIYRKKASEIPAGTAEQIRLITKHIRQIFYRRSIEKTQSAYTLIRLFDQMYAQENRSAGRLTFSDMPFLLSANGRLCTANCIGERLDSRFNHYAFDEFQDTSDTQWDVFAELVNELFQGDDIFRSLFCVGDVKQSIYQWRNGNPKLLKQ